MSDPSKTPCKTNPTPIDIPTSSIISLKDFPWLMPCKAVFIPELATIAARIPNRTPPETSPPIAAPVIAAPTNEEPTPSAVPIAVAATPAVMTVNAVMPTIVREPNTQCHQAVPFGSTPITGLFPQ